MFGGDRFEDLIGQISIGKSAPPSGGGRDASVRRWRSSSSSTLPQLLCN